MAHLDSATFEQAIIEAKKLVSVAAIYSHYKDRAKQYKILCLALDEASESVCVVYQALYEPYLTWIRPLANFLETVEWQGEKVKRFQIQ